MADNNEEWVPITVNMRKDDKEKFASGAKSVSGKARRVLLTWMEAEEEEGIRDDVQSIELACLKSYRNAIAKNINTMQHQKEKLDKKIEQMQEDGDDGEVLVELDLRMTQWDL